LARSLSRPLGPTTPADAFDARLLTFHARAADQDHAASTPDTAWPATRAAARLIPRTNPLLGFDVISTGFDASNDDARPEQEPGRTILERLPDPHLTRSSRAFSLSLTTTVFSQRSTGWFDAYPRRADAGGPTSLHLSHSTAFRNRFLHQPPPAFVTHRSPGSQHEEITHMHGFFDPAGSADGSRKRRQRCCLPLIHSTSAPRHCPFRGCITGLRAPRTQRFAAPSRVANAWTRPSRFARSSM
jgi:hypothetical protein